MRTSFFFFVLLMVTIIPTGCETSSNNGCGGTPGGGANDCQQMQTVNWRGAVGGQPTGPYKVAIEMDPDFNTHTIYRPVGVERKMPIVAWGNGGCGKNGTSFAEFLVELASHGFLIISDGAPAGGGTSPGSMANPTGEALIDAVDWAIDQNGRPCSPLYQKVDTAKIAVMGQSCGGLMTYGVAADPRLTTIVIWNSGLLQSDPKIYNSLHTPMAFFIGGSEDMAYSNAERDFAAITKKIPIFYGNLNVGHGGTYYKDNGGEFGRVGVAWLKYQLLGDQEPGGAQMFEGPNCGLCKTDWVIKKKTCHSVYCHPSWNQIDDSKGDLIVQTGCPLK